MRATASVIATYELVDRVALDVIETLCALAAANGDPRHHSPVRAWLAEATAAAVLRTPPYPDSVIVLEDRGHSGIFCLEVDEATQRRAVIEAKLNGYRRLFEANPTWKGVEDLESLLS